MERCLSNQNMMINEKVIKQRNPLQKVKLGGNQNRVRVKIRLIMMESKMEELGELSQRLEGKRGSSR